VTGAPLLGLSVLAAEQMHSLPHATQLLALLGAEVIKVEPLDGDTGRNGAPAVTDRDGRQTGSTFLRNNMGKASVAIDLKQEAGRDLFLRLATTVDAVAENFRPGTVERLGIGYDAVRSVHPSVIYVSVSGFGNTTDPPSPYREWAAYAPIVEGMAGLYEYSRDGDGPPRPAVAGALGDTGPGLYAVIGLLAALHRRQVTGQGGYVDVSMYDSMIAIADVVHPASMGVLPSRALDGIGILHAFRAKDGWFTVEVVREAHFPRFARAIGHDEWARDERLRTRSGWSTHMDTIIRPGVEQWAATLTKLDAATRLAAAGVAAGPVNSAADIVADPHVRNRRFVHDVAAGSGTAAVSVVGNPILFGSAADRHDPSRAWPALGEDTDAILSGRLGLDHEAIARMRASGVVA
jgi:crotonobetainyl-CoA:carnitine CoA-transferase CaiB-like acyl-CoA transferase